MVLWSVKRSAKSQTQASRKGAANAADAATSRAPFGERLVAAINIATLAGLPLACGVYIASNRLIPLNVEGRADVELAWFFSAWGLALLWALACAVVRPSRMGWSVPLGAAGLVWALLPFINALTTHTHLGVTLPAGEWVWASMDLAFLATGLLLGWLSWRLRPGRWPRGTTAAAKAPRAAPAAALPAAPDVSVSTSGA
jgi:hypothetical protein